MTRQGVRWRWCLPSGSRLLVVIVALAALLVSIDRVSAHASLVSAEPRDGSVLAAAPKMVQLRFNEPIVPAVVQLIDARGKIRTDAQVRALNDLISIALPDGMPDGTDVISYRVISADGHPVSGSVMFSIGAVTGAAASTNPTPMLASVIWLARIGVYLGLFVGIGGVFFLNWIAAVKRRSGVVEAALLVGLLSTILALGLQGLDLQGLAFFEMLTPAPWLTAMQTSLGPSLLLAAVAMACALAASASAATARALSVIAMVGVGASLAASGHASSASPQWLTRTSVFLHGICVAYWVGAFAPLLAMLRQRTVGLLPTLHRFSRGAVPMVGLLALTGLVLAVIQLESFGALVATTYGWILSAKLVLVATLLGLAGLNRWRLTPRLTRDRQATGALLRAVAAEGVVAIAILAVVAGWRFTPPPRSLAAAARSELSVHLHTDKGMVQVSISPGVVGASTFELQFMNEDLTPLRIKEAAITLTLPGRGIEPIDRPATRVSDDVWTVQGVPLPFPGRWRIRVDGYITDFDKLSVEDAFEVP